MATMTPTQKARVFRHFVHGAIMASTDAHDDIEAFAGPDSAHQLVERQLFKKLTQLALRLGLTHDEWDTAMSTAMMWERQVLPQGEPPAAYYAYTYGRQAVEIADEWRNDPRKRLNTKLVLYKRRKIETYGEDALGVPLEALEHRAILRATFGIEDQLLRDAGILPAEVLN